MDYQEVQNYQEPKRNLGKVLWTIFFSLLFVGVIIILFFVLTGNQKSISENKLLEGASVELGANNSVKLKFGEEYHNIKINFVGLDFVDLTISSNPIEIKGLKINEVKEIDLNNDGIADLRIKLVSIQNGKAVLFVKKIEKEIVCEENWVCGNWSSCVLGSQGRDCVDENSCGTIENRPDLERSCSFNNSNNNSNLNNTELSDLEKYIQEVKSKDCSAYVAPNCGTTYENNIPEYNKTLGNIILTIPVYDESCAAVCFGNAFRNNCQNANLIMVNDKGSLEKLEILGLSNNGNCSVKLSFEDISASDVQSIIYDGTYLTCPLPVGTNDLTSYSCPLDSCLEENMPGQTTLGVFSSIGIALVFGIAEDAGCVGTALEVEQEVCVENWNCTNWNDCVGGIQTRSCIDLNGCGTIINKPSVSQSCIVPTSSCDNDGVCDSNEDFLNCVDCLQNFDFFSNVACENVFDCDNQGDYSLCALGFCAKPVQELSDFVIDNFDQPPNCQDILCDNCEKGYLITSASSSGDFDIDYCVECTPNGFALCNENYICYLGKCIEE